MALKPGDLIEVEWLDAYSGDDQGTARTLPLGTPKDATVRTIGYFVAQDADWILLAWDFYPNVAQGDDTFRGVYHIPKAWKARVRILVPQPRWKSLGQRGSSTAKARV